MVCTFPPSTHESADDSGPDSSPPEVEIASLAPDAAILDVNLNGSQTWPVARVLSERRNPFVMATGYGAAGVPEPFAKVPILGKPFDAKDLERALRAALARAWVPPCGSLPGFVILHNRHLHQSTNSQGHANPASSALEPVW